MLAHLETLPKSGMVSKFLLACGILAPLVFVGTDLFAGTQWRGYNFILKSISELSAVGSPTRPYAVPLFMTQSVLVAAFGFGVWGQANQNTALRIIAGLLIANGVVSLAATALFPTEVGVRPSPLSVNVILGAAGVIFLLMSMGFGVAAFTNWFRFYSIGTLVAFAVLTILGFVAQTQPRIGLQERIMSYASLLWIGLLGIVLLTRDVTTDPV